ncbi:MAG TPA: signal peptidase I [Moraxellaceae bacterium]|nr:signal peptidase I [Moraxellaceae bacterium]
MDFDIALFLTLLVLASGAIWGFDLLVLKPRRKASAEAAVARLRGSAEGGAVTDEAVAGLTAREMREPTLVEYAHSFFPVLLVVWLLRSFLFEPFTIPSGSMLPTLQVGDYILVNKYAYGLRLPVLGTHLLPVGQPQRGDIMVFKYPVNPSQNFIKRVIGLPGDRVRVVGGQVWVNGSELARVPAEFPGADSWELYYREQTGKVSHLIRHEDGREGSSPQAEWVVPAGHYFMMGDNRDNSKDSRFWGFVPDRYIVGRASIIWMHKDPGLHLPSFGRNGKVD